MEWEQNFIGFIEGGGNLDEFELEEINEISSPTENNNNTLNQKQLVQYLEYLNKLKCHASENGNTQLFASTENTIRELEWTLTECETLIQPAITQFFYPL